MDTVRVVLAEDNALLRQGVEKLIAQQDGLELVGTADDLPGLLELVEEVVPHVVVTDIRMPPTGTDEGIRAAEVLRETTPTWAWWSSASTRSPPMPSPSSTGAPRAGLSPEGARL